MQRTATTASDLVGLDQLAPTTRELYKLIANLCKKTGECFAKQKYLADKMNVTTRTIREHKADLLERGLIVEERTGRATILRIAQLPLRAEESSDQSGSDFLSDRKNLPIRPADSSDRVEMRPYKNEPIQQPQHSAAAAGEEILSELAALGMPASVRDLAKADQSLAIAVLQHCQFMFSPSSRKRIKSKPGYIVACLRRPSEFALTKDQAGQWQAPEGQGAASKAAPAVDPREAECFANILAYDALPLSDQKRIEEFVRRRAALFSDATSGNAVFRRECVAVMVQWRAEGKLNVEAAPT